MAHRIEQKMRAQEIELPNGVDVKKVNDAIGFITHRVGQKGKTVESVSVFLLDLYSVKEIQTLAYKLTANHRLRIKDISSESGWHTTFSRAHQTH